MTAMLRTLFWIVDTIAGLIAGFWIPIVVTFVFCYLCGFNPITFIGICVSTFMKCMHDYWVWITPQHIAEFQKWFRDMVF